ncbi:MAG: hypothetical protein Q8936_04155 [Bacillota bacterium]|nr:hypothetical protein [Bacillota bacterium]
MKKTNKLYLKALAYYQNGYIDKSMETCERCIALDVRNNGAVGLKGLLYYLKGDIDNAKALWKLNLQVNKDGAAEKYLQNLKEDEKRLKLYIQAIQYINDIKISEALELLNECDESDFNRINISNAKTDCYIKLGRYNEAEKEIEKVLGLDKFNDTALTNKQSLIQLGVVKRNIRLKPIILTIAIAILIVIILYNKNLIFSTMKKVNLNINHKSKETTSSKANNGINKQQNVKASNSSVGKKEALQKNDSAQQVPFPIDEVKKSMSSKDYESVYNYLVSWKGKNLAINDKVVYADGEKLIEDEGIEFFYKNGSAEISNKDFAKAQESLKKAYEYGSKSYLYPHIIYFLGESFKASGDIENSLKYYEQYDSQYSNGDYEETVLYDLAIMYKDVDINKSKQYAQKLTSSFPNSIYNNTNIKQILSN